MHVAGRGKRFELLLPYDVRPALSADTALIRTLLSERFGTVPLPKIILLNKTGGVDRADLVIMHGERFGWLTFDPVTRKFSFDLAPEALPYILSFVKHGILDLDLQTDARKEQGRIGGKKIPLKTPFPEGTVIVKYKKPVRNRYGKRRGCQSQRAHSGCSPYTSQSRMGSCSRKEPVSLEKS